MQLSTDAEKKTDFDYEPAKGKVYIKEMQETLILFLMKVMI